MHPSVITCDAKDNRDNWIHAMAIELPEREELIPCQKEERLPEFFGNNVG